VSGKAFVVHTNMGQSNYHRWKSRRRSDGRTVHPSLRRRESSAPRTCQHSGSRSWFWPRSNTARQNLPAETAGSCL